MDEAELERMVEERYGRGSSFIRYAEDGYDDREAADWDEYPPLFRDPTIWKVKCMVGREKHSVFCLMQKYVDLQPLGTKLQIISAFSLDRVKGFIYIEADRQQDLFEACKGLSNIYVSRVTPVKPDEWSYLLSERSKGCVTTAGMWARVKRGKYKGDLGQIVAVNEARKKATVKLIPRIDLQALTEKIGGGVSMKKNSIPAPPRLISSREIEQFGPLIQMRRDRDTNTTFEVLDGMMLKDGYLYKKITIDSLSVWGAMPTEDELLKFEPPNNTESMDFEFLSVLYGNDNRNKEQIMKNDKGDGKGEGSSTSNVEYSFEVHDLVFFGKKDFGVIIGMEKDDNFKIMKEGTEGPLVLTLPARDLKSASFDKKLFTAKDLHMKKISVSDRVRVMDSPLKDKEGVVKRIYKGIIFLFNESEEEHNGYTCFKSQICEKVISASQESHEQGNESGPSGLGESPSSPNSTPTPKKSWQGRENSSFNQEDKNSMFSVGQSLRIKVGPLKGYLCRVLAIRRSDVTVKLDSQQKVLTVKSKHLSEVRGKSSASVTRGDQESAKPFDLLGTTDGSRGANSRKILDGGSSRTKDGGSIWGKPTGPSWGQQVDAKAVEVHDRTKSNQSWHNQAGSSWNKQVGGSSWKGKGGGSGLNKTAGGSRGKTTSGSAWGLQAVANTEKPNTTTDQPQGIKGAGGSSTGWGKGSWGKSSTDDALEDHKSAWTSKRDWGAGIDFSERQEQAQKISRGRGRGGSSRGGRGGRGESDRDSYGVRGSSGGGGFMGRGGNFGCRDGSDQGGRGSSGLGGFRARKGSFGGRDGSDQEGRRGSGRGGLPGRGGSLGGRNGSDQDQGGRCDSGLGGFRGKGGSFGGRDGSDQGGRGGSGRGGFRGRGGSFRGRDGSAQGGRGGSGRGGFRGRDGSDQEGYGGRGRSDRGGFRGRGHSNFGGRGRGRSDQYGGNWNNINDSGEEKPTGWSKSSWRADGGKSNENKANWNQGGADSGQWKGWSTMSQSKGGVDGYARQKKSWSSGGSWSKPGNNGGWNKGSTFGSGNNDGADASESGGPTESWGNAAARSWGKPKGGF